jgi:hypothetical protein
MLTSMYISVDPSGLRFRASRSLMKARAACIIIRQRNEDQEIDNANREDGQIAKRIGYERVSVKGLCQAQHVDDSLCALEVNIVRMVNRS